jgi:hypothetical protein
MVLPSLFSKATFGLRLLSKGGFWAPHPLLRKVEQKFSRRFSQKVDFGLRLFSKGGSKGG